MKREYHPLSAHRLESGARYHQPGQDPERVRIDSPALAVMTDLRQIPAATIDLEAPLDAASRFMIRRGVRLLLVTDDDRQVLGLITSNEVSGEKAVQFALERGIKRQEIRVRDLMTPREQLEVPMFWWLPPEAARGLNVDVECLRRKATGPASHDNLYHSVLGLLSVETAHYRSERDLFQGCRNPSR